MDQTKGVSNSITDVTGVKVGHITLYEKRNEKDTICTGVTAILPHGGNLFTTKTRAASTVINGYGKTAGLIQLDELGLLESPIMLTNTFSVGAVMQGTLTYMLENNKEIGDTASSLNIFVGECNDSYLNSMRLQAVKPEHAIQAIESASTNPAKQGAVGAGKGMICFDYKGGIGSASRIVSAESAAYTVGCLVLSNFGKREDALFADWGNEQPDTPDGSIMIVLATDAPLYDRQLKRLAERSAAGLGRVGSYIANGSGDIAIAFSTANPCTSESDNHLTALTHVRDDHTVMNRLFQAAVETTEEAIINSLTYAETTMGRKGRIVQKAPL